MVTMNDYITGKKKLLTDGSSNTKTAKNSKQTYYLSLQPVDQNSMGENLCKFSTAECRNVCLQFAGRQSFDNVVKSRTLKTDFFVTNRKVFLDRLIDELDKLNTKGNVAVRLNLLSDVNWEMEMRVHHPDIDFETDFKNIQFYDYTKDPMKVLSPDKAKNYHLTFSFSGGNWYWCNRILQETDANIAVVFKNGLPLTWNGYRVVDGDLTDERFLDPHNVIVGLKYKTAKGVPYKKSKFVIEV
jgi:hypothetical protein